MSKRTMRPGSAHSQHWPTSSQPNPRYPFLPRSITQETAFVGYELIHVVRQYELPQDPKIRSEALAHPNLWSEYEYSEDKETALYVVASFVSKVTRIEERIEEATKEIIEGDSGFQYTDHLRGQALRNGVRVWVFSKIPAETWVLGDGIDESDLWGLKWGTWVKYQGKDKRTPLKPRRTIEFKYEFPGRSDEEPDATSELESEKPNIVSPPGGRLDAEAWDSLRRQVYKRDGYTCANCGAKGGGDESTELHAHHIVPVSRGGTNVLTNLKTLCRDCHEKVHPYMRD